jgi:hypothetical protein
MIEHVLEYIKSLSPNSKTKISSYIVWEVIARYYIEEHFRFYPYDFQMFNKDEHSPKQRIFKFFQSKNINLQDKINLYTQQKTFYESIVEYFYQHKDQKNY